MFIGVSLLTDPTSARERDIWISLNRGGLAGKEPHEPQARTLGHLAVLLCGPIVSAAELGAIGLARELTREHQPLVA